MNDKICPMYKAALLSYVGPLGYLKTNDEKAIKCDGAECGWWVEKDHYICIRGTAPCTRLGEECVACPDYRNVPKDGHCGRIDG